MKRGTTEHPKISLLMRKLGLRRFEACGLMECIWHYTGRYAPRGDVLRQGPECLATSLGWDRPVEDLLTALRECRLLDELEGGTAYIHDWHDHSCDYSDKYLRDKGLNYLNGAPTKRQPTASILREAERRRRPPSVPSRSKTSRDKSVEAEAETETELETKKETKPHSPPLNPQGPRAGSETSADTVARKKQSFMEGIHRVYHHQPRPHLDLSMVELLAERLWDRVGSINDERVRAQIWLFKIIERYPFNSEPPPTDEASATQSFLDECERGWGKWVHPGASLPPPKG